MNTNVSFELAKMLKEKGFDMNCSDYYTSIGKLYSDGGGDAILTHGFGSGDPVRLSVFDYSDFNKRQKETYYLCPIISEVVMWVYEKHGIWIYPLPIDDDMKLWQARIIKGESFNKLSNTLKIISHGEISYRGLYSPKEAYEAGIIYTLKNLI